MDLFTYLMAKNGNNSSVHGDLFSYLLGKGQSQTQTVSGVTIYIPDAKKLVNFIMTKESTQDGTPTPDNPVEVKTVKGYRNLFDFVNGNYVSGNGATINRIDGEYTIINVSSEYGGARFLQSDLQLKPNTNYTFGAMIKDTNSEIGSYVYIQKAMNLYNREKLGNIITSNGISIVKFTTPEEIPSTAFIGLYPRGLNVTATFTNIMIIEGDQELPCVPYGNNYIAVNISDGTNTNSVPLPLNNNEIAGIGNYLDEYIVDKSGHCWLNRKTGKVVLNGSEDEGWFIDNSGTPSYSYRIRLNGTVIAQMGLSNNFIRTNITNSNTYEGFDIRNANNKKEIRIRYGIEDTLENFKTWLSSHNTEVYYVLATPELIDLQTTVDLKLFKGANTITNSEDANMTIEYR